MAWYRTGTVTLTAGSATVAGAGTDFVSNVRVGDAFIDPNGGQHEVTNIASATAISISPAWSGATIAGATYSIMPVNGYVKKLADSAAQMIADWGSILAGIGPVASQSVVPVNMGGTGATTAAAARTALGLKSAALADIVGTVAQAGGAIFQRGTSANGSYVLLADGTALCWSSQLQVAGIANANVGITWQFPATFSAAPVGLPAVVGVLTADDYRINRLSMTPTGGSQAVITINASVAQTYYLCALAIGRWY